MTNTPRALSRPEGDPVERLRPLLAERLASGAHTITVDDILAVLRTTVLTPDVYARVLAVFEEHGIALEGDLSEIDELTLRVPRAETDETGESDGSDPGGEATVALAVVDVEGDGGGNGDGPGRVATLERRTGTRKAKVARPPASATAAPGAGGTADSVRMYLKEIGRVHLLTQAGEVELARRYEAGLAAAAELAAIEELQAGAHGADAEAAVADPEVLDRLRELAADGEEAKRALIQANLRLVVSIAKRYVGRGMLLLDLIQEGNLGLMRAVEKFDYSKGFKFSTYATWWIRQAITRAIADQARTIRIPVHMVESINKVMRVQRQMLQELEREPRVEELAERVDMTPERVREILRISQDPLSLDSPVGEEDDSNLADFIEDQQAEAPAEAAARRLLSEAVAAALDELTERERNVVRMRFGLDDGKARTLEEVGKEFGVTRERIRQIEAKTLAKLRHPQRSQKLRDYLEGE